ncbi:general stress protein [Sporosarcina sp. 179-K 3D1 HS]|uniref:general stress protein n=1 Tax=Sporosarcina sp. 179-K 3D1 HS TaxID=3232169 RepID=UPI0039A063FD
MAETSFIGVFDNENDLIAKIDELKLKGYTEENIYIITRDNTDITMVKARTGAEIERTGGSWWDRFTSFLSGEEPVQKALGQMGLDPIEAENYYKLLEGGAMLLFVDHGEYGQRIRSNDDVSSLDGAGTDPNLGANLQQPENQMDIPPIEGIPPGKRI